MVVRNVKRNKREKQMKLLGQKCITEREITERELIAGGDKYYETYRRRAFSTCVISTHHLPTPFQSETTQTSDEREDKYKWITHNSSQISPNQ